MNRYIPCDVASVKGHITTESNGEQKTQGFNQTTVATKPHFFGMLISSVKSVPSLVSGAGDLVGGALAKGCGQVFCGVTCCMATAYVGHVACEGTGVGYQKGDDGTVKVFVDYRLRGASEMWGQVKDDVKSVKATITRQGDVEKVDSNPSDPQAEALSNSRSEGGGR